MSHKYNKGQRHGLGNGERERGGTMIRTTRKTKTRTKTRKTTTDKTGTFTGHIERMKIEEHRLGQDDDKDK